MELFTNTYQSHDVVGVIVFSCIMGLVGLSLLGGALYTYCSSPPVLTVDPVVGNLPSGEITELQFMHPETESAVFVNCALEESLNVEVLIIPIMLILLLTVIYFYL